MSEKKALSELSVEARASAEAKRASARKARREKLGDEGEIP